MVVAQRQGIFVIRAAGDVQDTVQPFAGTHDEFLIDVRFEEFHTRKVGRFESREFFLIEVEAVG
jgi:hypothetical protein